MIEMNGTADQIKWADDIKQKFIADMIRKATNNSVYGKNKANDQQVKVLTDLLTATCNEFPGAKWWIDNRNDLISVINDTYVKKAQEMGLA
jgi:hypothetical protein